LNITYYRPYLPEVGWKVVIIVPKQVIIYPSYDKALKKPS